MWNLLLTLIIIIILFFLNPLKNVDLKPATKLDNKTQSDVNQVVNQVQQQVDYARQMQRQESTNPE